MSLVSHVDVSIIARSAGLCHPGRSLVYRGLTNDLATGLPEGRPEKIPVSKDCESNPNCFSAKAQVIAVPLCHFPSLIEIRPRFEPNQPNLWLELARPRLSCVMFKSLC